MKYEHRSFCRFLANVNMASSVRLSSVTFVHPTQAIEIFGNVSTPFGTLAIYWHPGKILQRSSQGNPSVGELNTRGVAEYGVRYMLSPVRLSVICNVRAPYSGDWNFRQCLTFYAIWYLGHLWPFDKNFTEIVKG